MFTDNDLGIPASALARFRVCWPSYSGLLFKPVFSRCRGFS